MKKLVIIFGTRPEFIKIYPIYKEAQQRGHDVVLVNTGQHREMLDQLLNAFDVKVDYDLKIMDKCNGLTSILTNSLSELEEVIKSEKDIDYILVHGDTSATLAGSIIAYYHQIKLMHIEAGLRTHNKFAPFPEEMNRHLTGVLSDVNFAPTMKSKENLLKENIAEDTIHVVGNSSIDMLKYTVNENYDHEILNLLPDKKLVLITVHRRENLDDLDAIFSAINRLAVDFSSDYKFVYPIHLNPRIREVAKNYFDEDNIKIIEPLDTIDFHNVMNKSYIIMTDSGGIQEEAPSLGKPVLVLRDTTERPEGVEAGTLKVVGTNASKIYDEAAKLLLSEDAYQKMSLKSNPYGDGTTSKQILDVIDSL